MSIDLDTTRALATTTRDALHDVPRHPDDPPTVYTCAVCQCDAHTQPEGPLASLCGACAYDRASACAAALLLACDEVEVLRAQVAELQARVDRLATLNEGEIARRFVEARREEEAQVAAVLDGLARRPAP